MTCDISLISSLSAKRDSTEAVGNALFLFREMVGEDLRMERLHAVLASISLRPFRVMGGNRLINCAVLLNCSPRAF